MRTVDPNKWRMLHHSRSSRALTHEEVRMLKKLSSRAGQTLVLMAIALPSLLGAMALAIDVWNLYVNWTHLQTGADAAVLAGANYLPTYPDQAISTAETYAQNNKILAGEIVSTTLSDDNLEITMKATRTVP